MPTAFHELFAPQPQPRMSAFGFQGAYKHLSHCHLEFAIACSPVVDRNATAIPPYYPTAGTVTMRGVTAKGYWLSIGAVGLSVRPRYFFRRPGLGPAAID